MAFQAGQQEVSCDAGISGYTVHRTLLDSGIVWNGEQVPVVDKYCYLGLWFHNTCSWSYHVEQMLLKAEKVAKRLMPLWKNRHVCVEVKRIVLLSLSQTNY